MKRALFATCSTILLAAAAACASSDDGDGGPDLTVREDSGATLAEDASPDGGSAPDTGDAAVDGPACSSAGWCATTLPVADLTLRDVWPTSGRTFAVGVSPTVGARVLEWNDADAKWSYIDDNTQNEDGRGAYVGRIWAPSENELYYTVAPRMVYRGVRDPASQTPATAWSWTHWQLEDRVPAYPSNPQYPNHYLGLPRYALPGTHSDWGGAEIPALGVFGTSANDVYAWYANTIYHLSNDDAGVPAWTVEYVADDRDRPDEQLVFLAATATSSGDVWFAGGRGGAAVAGFGGGIDPRLCSVLVRKTASSYQRVADGEGVGFGFPMPPLRCKARAGTAYIAGPDGWITDIQTGVGGSIVGLKAARDLTRITVTDDGVDGGPPTLSVDSSPFPQGVAKAPLLSFWVVPNEPTIWLGGVNLVARADDPWQDGGTYQVSTISLNGAWLTTSVNQVRGSSNNVRWAVGARYALRKTNP